jgi:hypothetical protein
MRSVTKNPTDRKTLRIGLIWIDGFDRPVVIGGKQIVDWKRGVRDELQKASEMIRSLAHTRYESLDTKSSVELTTIPEDIPDNRSHETQFFQDPNDTDDFNDFDAILDDLTD